MILCFIDKLKLQKLKKLNSKIEDKSNEKNNVKKIEKNLNIYHLLKKFLISKRRYI